MGDGKEGGGMRDGKEGGMRDEDGGMRDGKERGGDERREGGVDER